MKKNFIPLLISSLLLTILLFSFAFIFGCGQGAVLTPPGPEAPWISERNPDINGSFNSAFGILSIVFGKQMNTSLNGFSTGEGHTAGNIQSIMDPPYWTKTQDGKDQLNVPLAGVMSTGEVVLVSDTDGFKTSDNSETLTGDTELWRFNYSYDPSVSFNIQGNITFTTPTTVTGTIYAFATEHSPTVGDLTGIRAVTMSAASVPFNYTLSGLGSGEYYVAAFMDNWPDGQYTVGEPWAAHGGGTPAQITVGPSQTGKNADLQANAFAIIGRAPNLDATGIAGTNLQVSLTFNNALNPYSLTFEAFGYDPTHTAGIPIITTTPEISSDMTNFSLLVENWMAGSGNYVNIIATTDAKITDINGSTIDPPETFWRGTLDTNTVSGTITGGTSETVAIFLFAPPMNLTSPDAFGLTYLSDGSAGYGVSGFADGTYYVTAWSPRSGDFDSEIQPNDLMGIYLPGNLQALSFSSSNRTRTNINFPLSCWTGFADPILAPYISGQITSATTESYMLSVGISSKESYFSFSAPPEAKYNLPSPNGSSNPQNYYFSGLLPDTYYIAAVQKVPGNTNPWPESGDYLGTAEVNVLTSPVTGQNIYMQKIP